METQDERESERERERERERGKEKERERGGGSSYISTTLSFAMSIKTGGVKTEWASWSQNLNQLQIFPPVQLLSQVDLLTLASFL